MKNVDNWSFEGLSFFKKFSSLIVMKMMNITNIHDSVEDKNNNDIILCLPS